MTETPHDVVHLIASLAYILYVTIGVVLLKILITLWAWFDVRRMLHDTRMIDLRVERLLSMAVIHGEITDAQKDRVVNTLSQIRDEANMASAAAAAAAKQAADKVVIKVEEVPDKVVDRMIERGSV